MGVRIIALLFLVCSCVAQQQGTFPATLPQVTVNGGEPGMCPSQQVLEQTRNNTKEAIKSVLRSTVVPTLEGHSSQCPCGSPGPWRRIAHLNMADPNQQCPANWRLNTATVRACGRSTESRSCDSAVFSANNQLYSHVCGRVIATQKGAPEAFIHVVNGKNAGLEGLYVDGVSLTHGAAGSRQHIWTFAAAEYETERNAEDICSCTNTNRNWPYQLPSFIGTNYFCDTGNPGPSSSGSRVFSDDPLWDGQGCGPVSSCCEFNTPPWFCTTLPQPTTDDVELRICSDGNSNTNEDILVQLVDIFAKY